MACAIISGVLGLGPRGGTPRDELTVKSKAYRLANGRSGSAKGLFGSSGFKTGPAKSPSKFGKTGVFETGAAERALMGRLGSTVRLPSVQE